MLNRLNKRGEQMVEASIVLPIIILVIMLLVRLCTFYLECLIAQTNMHRNMLAPKSEGKMV